MHLIIHRNEPAALKLIEDIRSFMDTCLKFQQLPLAHSNHFWISSINISRGLKCKCKYAHIQIRTTYRTSIYAVSPRWVVCVSTIVMSHSESMSIDLFNNVYEILKLTVRFQNATVCNTNSPRWLKYIFHCFVVHAKRELQHIQI